MASHYHIRWGSGQLDWERFETEYDAEASARHLIQYKETYRIEEFDESCPRCMKAANLKYPWQRLVLEACKALPSDLPFKISIAERAISERVRDRATPFEEDLALKEALETLDTLLPTKGKGSEDEEEAESA